MRGSPIALSLLLTALVLTGTGCGHSPTAPAGRADFSLRVRWATPGNASIAAVDSLVAVVSDSAVGSTLAGPVKLTLAADRTFSGSLQVPIGRTFYVDVRAFAGGELFYSGRSAAYTMGSGGILATVTMAPSVSLLAFPSLDTGTGSSSDSVDVALFLTNIPLRGLQADITFTPAELSFARVVNSGGTGLTGFGVSQPSPGRLRVIYFDDSGLGRIAAASNQLIGVFRFAACGTAGNACVSTSAVGLDNAVAATARRQSAPVALQGGTVTLQGGQVTLKP